MFGFLAAAGGFMGCCALFFGWCLCRASALADTDHARMWAEHMAQKGDA